MSKIEKTIARQKQKVEEGQYYEAHQQLRVIASRYVKSSQYDAAIDLLYGGAQLLLDARQGGSGGDLCMYLMDVYKAAETKPDAQSKGKLLTLMRAFPEGEPTRKRFVGEVGSWSAKMGEYPAGDPELHHVAGQLMLDDGDVYEAERQLALGTRESASILANLEYDWYSTDSPHTAPLYVARAVFPFLLAGSLRAANAAFLLFTSKLSSTHPQLGVQAVTSASSEARVYQSLPLLNFLSLLLLACQKGAPDLLKSLRQHYKAQLIEATEGNWDEALEGVGQMYFGIKPPRQGNPLMDMMGSMFGGGGFGGGGSQPKSKQQKVEVPAPAPGLD